MTLEQNYIYKYSEKVEEEYAKCLPPDIKYKELAIVSPYQFAHLLYLYFEKQIDRKALEYLVNHYEEYSEYILTYNKENILQLFNELLIKEEKLYQRFHMVNVEEKEKIVGIFIGKLRKQLPRSTNILLLSQDIRQQLGLPSLESKENHEIKREYDEIQWYEFNKNYRVYLTRVLKLFYRFYNKKIKITWKTLPIDNLSQQDQFIYNVFYKTIVIYGTLTFTHITWYHSNMNVALQMYDNIKNQYIDYTKLFSEWKETKDLRQEYTLKNLLTNLIYQFSLYTTLKLERR